MVRDTFINQFGCDSILITNTTYLAPSVSRLTTTTCDPSELRSDTTFLENYLGCDSSTSEVNITSPEKLTLDLGLPNEINLGEPLEINPQVNQPIDTFIWEIAGDSLFCDSCLIQNLQPHNSAQYQLTVLTASGCSTTEVFVVNVRKDRAVYAPNAFSPNQDGNNDVFMIYGGPEVARVKNLKIFNRWGALVFSDENFPTDDLSHGWDGTFKGKPVNPGVFIYHFEIEFVDGYTKAYQGDVTIMR